MTALLTRCGISRTILTRAVRLRRLPSAVREVPEKVVQHRRGTARVRLLRALFTAPVRRPCSGNVTGMATMDAPPFAAGWRVAAGMALALHLLLLALAPGLAAQDHRVTFEHFTVNDGLSQNLVSAILQDSRGFLWLGTKDGLNKFDGYGFEKYHRLPFDRTSLSDDYITTLFEDSSDRLWIGTFRGGLNLLNRETNSFLHFNTTPPDRPTPGGDQITSIQEDRDGSIWIGSYAGGLTRLRPATYVPSARRSEQNHPEAAFELATYSLDPGSPSTTGVLSLKVDSFGTLWIGTTSGLYSLENSASGPRRAGVKEARSDIEDDPTAVPAAFRRQPIYPADPSLGVGAIFEDSSGTLWFGTPKGLFQLDRNARAFVAFPYPSPEIAASLGSIAAICEFAPGQSTSHSELWLGAFGGVAIFDVSAHSFTILRHDPADPKSLSAGRILSIYRDRSGVMWLGSNGNGLNKYDPLSTRFPCPDYSNVDRTASPRSVRSLSIRSFYEDPARHRNVLWIGTSRALFRVDREAGSFEQVSGRGGGSPDFGAVYSILQDAQGTLWIAGGQGLFEYDPESGTTRQYKPGLLQEDGQEDNRVFKLCQDDDGSLWVVTARTLARFSPQDRRFEHYRYRQDPPNRFEQPIFPSMYKDRAGAWWIGTETGLYRFDAASRQFKHYVYDPGNPAGLNSIVVRAVEPDPLQPERYLWLGTAGGGLNRLDLASDTFTHYSRADGLANEFVYGVLGDDQGTLWLSTNSGLSRLDLRSMTFRNYDVSDGLQGNEFNSGAYFRSSSGELFFGGIAGFNAFFPATIRTNSHVPAIVITTIHVSSPSSTPQERVLYPDNSPSHMDEIRLSYRDKILSLQFAALSFSMPQRNRYAYKLEGLNDSWIETAEDRRATFTYLSPGEYVFRVKGSNNDGVWNEEGAALRVIITPPLWMTWWAYTLYTGVVFFALFCMRRYELNRVRLKHDLELLQEDGRLAASIQQSLLPKHAPRVPGYEIAARTLPCRTVGGDYHDFIPIDELQTVITIGDAAGKAMAAALLMANLQAVVRCQSAASASVEDCVRIANKILFQNTDSNSFVTLFYSVLNSATHRLRFCNAGHNYPLMFSSGSNPLELRTGGTIVGVFEDSVYQEEEVQFRPGDLLVLYSDGITEAMNSADEEFGAERLVSLVAANRQESPGRLMDLILDEVHRHMGDLQQQDDITLVIVRRTE